MSDQQLDQHELQQEENKLIAQRKEKLAAVREARAIAFPNDFRRDAYFADLQKQYADKTKEELEAAAIPVKVAGRIMLNRGSFIVLQDSSERLQVYVNRKTLPEETLAEIKTWDLGDIIGAEGVLARSGKGDLYVDMTSVRLLTKVAASAAGQAPWPDRHRAALPPALRRPDGQRGNPPHLPRALPGHRPHPPFPQRARFPRSGDPDAADHPRRRRG